jgi:hypothetical protein
LYCHEHMLQANALYAEYKAANATALATFADDALDQCIRLREEYAHKFLDYEDTGAHRAYICILKRVRLVTAQAAYSVAAQAAYSVAAQATYSVAAQAAYSVAAQATYSVAAQAAYSVAAQAAYSVAAQAAYRRAAYNHWMTESAHFLDFSAQGQAAVLHK